MFVSETLRSFSLQDAIHTTNEGNFENIYAVDGIFGTHLRSLPNTLEKDNLDARSVTAADIIAYANRMRHFKSTDAISEYVTHCATSLSEKGGPFIETVDGDKAFVDVVRERVTSHAAIITQAAEEFEVDPYILGAIIIDEVVRLAPFEDIFDLYLLDLLGRNVSVGIAQVKLETANNIIKKGLYNPNSKDAKLSFYGNLRNSDREYLYQYVIQPKHNIRFAAAYIRDIINVWAKKLDISERPEIIATLYSQGYGEPKTDPKPNKRGAQIATEFYQLAKKWVK